MCLSLSKGVSTLLLSYLLLPFSLVLLMSCRTYREDVKILEDNDSPTASDDNPLRTSMQSSFRISKLEPKPKSFDLIDLTINKLDGKNGSVLSSKSHEDYQLGNLIVLSPNHWYSAEIKVSHKGKVVGENKSCHYEVNFKADYGEVSKIGKLCPEGDD